MVRINPMSTAQGVADLAFFLEQPVLPDGFAIPKLDHASELVEAAEMIAEAERRVLAKTGKQILPLPIIGFIESPTAILNMPAIVSAKGAERLAGVVFGGDDYGSAVGATRTASNHEIQFARNFTLLHAKAAGIQAIDIVQKTFRDLDALRAECKEAAEMGYTGKQLIHPLQVAVTNEVFAPSPELLKWAKAVVDADAHHQSIGTGAFSLNGVMIDMPTVKIAAQLYARGIACGVTPAE
jgi:citrate lyase subunit beta-like protein